jgi:hypothetical protein
MKILKGNIGQHKRDLKHDLDGSAHGFSSVTAYRLLGGNR